MEMVRVKKDVGSNKIKWRKMGGGSFRMGDGRIIKPNQEFMAHPDEIPKAFRDTVVPVNPEELQDKENPVLDVAEDTFVVRERTPGWYDIVNLVTGKPINDAALRKKDADNFAKGLNR